MKSDAIVRVSFFLLLFLALYRKKRKRVHLYDICHCMRKTCNLSVIKKLVCVRSIINLFFISNNIYIYIYTCIQDGDGRMLFHYVIAQVFIKALKAKKNLKIFF